MTPVEALCAYAQLFGIPQDDLDDPLLLEELTALSTALADAVIFDLGSAEPLLPFLPPRS